MKRSAALAPLSRDHQPVLAAALRLRRATPDDVGAAVARISELWERDMQRHFAIEEELLVPALPAAHAAWAAGAARMCDEHVAIRGRMERLGAEDVGGARALGELLDRHVRFEERELFALLEQELDERRLEALGRAVEEAEAR